MNQRPPLLPLVALGLQLAGAAGAATPIVDWRDLDPGALRSTSLEVKRPVAVRITAVGTIGARERELIAYPWILDSETRKAVWILDPAAAESDARPRRKEGTVRVRQESTVQLEPGSYEIYFTTVGDARRVEISTWFGLSVGKKSSVRRVDAPARDDWQLTLAVEAGEQAAVVTGDEARPRFAPLLRIAAPPPSTTVRLPFRLDAKATVVVYAIGEYDVHNKTLADGGWIERGADREVVWQMTSANTAPAGGAEKNRLFRATVSLDPGTYVLCYASDDSHRPGAWNMNPPLDPEFWGVAIFDHQDARAHFTAGGDDPITKNRIVDLTRQGNNSFSMRGIRVKQPVDLRLYALGELGRGRFADYGWIEEARTHRSVWTMTGADSEPAGGAAKNRLVRATASLPAGEYLVCYVTDDSHAFGTWNAAPPRNAQDWGIQVWGAGERFNPQSIGSYDEDQDPLILAQLVRIGSRREAVEKFQLKQTTGVRILALGEGLHGQMFDYGWLERRDGGEELVWRMRYSETTPAGGNDKNRRQVAELDLKAGEYELHYVTDDSHAFADWNAWPPDQPHLWGVSVTKIK